MIHSAGCSINAIGFTREIKISSCVEARYVPRVEWSRVSINACCNR